MMGVRMPKTCSVVSKRPVINLVIAVLLVVVRPVVIQPARPRPTALPSPSSEGKPEAAVVAAPDDGREDARNMLSCI